MRLVFMGTPAFSVPTLHALHEDGHEILAVYTQPPRPAGRGKALRPASVQQAAEELGLSVHCPESLKDLSTQARFLALEADVAVVVAYGLILPAAVLSGPKHGCFNVHASLLPRWRGAAPIQRAILAGDHVTGITIMCMEPGLDTGPMVSKASTPIENRNSGELHDELAQLGAGLMVEALSQLDRLSPEQQDGREATYAAKIDKAEARLDFDKPALRLEREVRAFAPFPGTWFTLDGERIKVLAAREIGVNGAAGTVLDDGLTIACGNAALRPLIVKPAGKPVMPTKDFLRGRNVPVGTVLI